MAESRGSYRVVTFKVHRDTYMRIEVACKLLGITVSEFVRRAVEMYLNEAPELTEKITRLKRSLREATLDLRDYLLAREVYQRVPKEILVDVLGPELYEKLRIITKTKPVRWYVIV